MSAVGRAVKGGDKSLMALAVVVAVAVLREGSEVVLFLYGIVMSTKEGPLARSRCWPRPYRTRSSRSVRR